MIETKFKDTEIGKIPQEWEVKSLGEIGSFSKGSGVSRTESLQRGDYPVVRYGEIYTAYSDYIREFRSYISKQTANNAKLLTYGDLLFAASGETKEDIGKSVAFIGKMQAYAGGDIIIVSPKGEYDYRFLGYISNCKPVRDQKSTRGQGDAIVHIVTGDLATVLIPLPPISEQRRIADALSKVDSLIESLDKLIAKKKAIKRGAMQELLTGKKRLPGFEGEWRKKKIKDLALTSSGGTPSRDIPSYFNGNIRWFTTSELNDKYLFDSIEHINEEALKHSSCKIFPKGSILLAMYGATIGKLGILTAPSATNQACCSILAQKASSMYLFYWLLFQRNLIVSKGRGAGQPNISQAIINDLEVHLPIDTSEQRAIAHVLSTMDAEIDALTRKRDKYKQVKQGMMQDLLTGRIRLVDK